MVDFVQIYDKIHNHVSKNHMLRYVEMIFNCQDNKTNTKQSKEGATHGVPMPERVP